MGAIAKRPGPENARKQSWIRFKHLKIQKVSKKPKRCFVRKKRSSGLLMNFWDPASRSPRRVMAWLCKPSPMTTRCGYQYKSQKSFQTGFKKVLKVMKGQIKIQEKT